MTTVPRAEAALPPEDPALRFIRLELAPSPQRWIATLGFTGLALIGVLATVTFRISVPGAGLRRHPAADFAACTPPIQTGCRGDRRRMSWRQFRHPAGDHHPPTISPGSTYRCNVAALTVLLGALPRHCCAGGLHAGCAAAVLCRACLPARPGGRNRRPLCLMRSSWPERRGWSRPPELCSCRRRSPRRRPRRPEEQN